MSYSVEYRKIPSGDKIHSLNVKVYIPNGEKKGILQISHGMTEHIERYDDFMGFIAEMMNSASSHPRTAGASWSKMFSR